MDEINLDDYRELARLLEALNELKKNGNSLSAEQKQYIADAAHEHKDILDNLQRAVRSSKEHRKLVQEILDMVIDTAEAYQLQRSISRDVLGSVRKHIDLIKERNRLEASPNVDIQSLADSRDAITSNFSELTKSVNISRGALAMLDDEMQKLSAIEDIISIKGEAGKKQIQELLTLAGYSDLAAAAENTVAILSQEVAMRKAAAKEAQRQLSQQVLYNKLLSSATNKVEAMFTKYSTLALLIPGIGKQVHGMIVDAKEDIVDALKVTTDKFAQTGNIVQSIKAGLSNLTSNISKGVIVVGALAAAFSLVYKIMNNIYDTVFQVSQSTGLAVSQSYELFKNSLKAQTVFQNQVSSLEDVLNVQKAISEEFGRFTSTDPKIVSQISDAAKTLGYTTESAGALHAVLTQLGAEDGLAGNMQVAYGELAKAYKIAPGLITKDLVDNAGFVATAFAGMPEKAMQSAVEIRKLGYNLAQAEKTMNHLFDIQGSLTAQMEASVGLGRLVDMSMARQAALSGDMVGMMQEISNQVGTYNELMGMSVPQRMLLARAAGMEVSELQRSMFIQEKLSHLSDEELATAQKALKNVEGLEKMNGEMLHAELSRVQNAEKFNNAISKLKNEIMTALLPLVESLAVGFGVIAPIIGLAGKFIRGMLFPLEMLGKLIEIVQSKFGGISASAGDVASTIALWSGGIFAGVKMLGLIVPSITGIGSLMGKVFSLKTYSGFFKGMAARFVAMAQTITGGGLLDKIKNTILGTPYGGGQFMPGGGRAPAGGARHGGLLGRNRGAPSTPSPPINTAAPSTPPPINPAAPSTGTSWTSTISNINTKKLLQGAAAMAVASAGVYIFAKAIQELEKVKDPTAVAAGLAGFVLTLGISAAILHAASSVLVPAAAVLLAFGGAVALFGVGIEKASNGITKLIDSLSLDKIANVYKLGPALAIAASGLTAFSAAMLSGSVSKGVSSLFGGGILSTIKKLTEQAEPLQKVADAIERINTSMGTLGSYDVKTPNIEAPKIANTSYDPKPVVEAPKVPKISYDTKANTTNPNTSNAQDYLLSKGSNSSIRTEQLLSRLVSLMEISNMIDTMPVNIEFNDEVVRTILSRSKRQ